MLKKSPFRSIFNRNVDETYLRKRVGKYINGYLTHAKDEQIRMNAASGGTVTALLIYMMKNNMIDGALLTGIRINKNQPRPYFFIARSPEEILTAQGSKYAAVSFAAEAVPLLKNFQGRVAVAALPCDAKLLQHLREKDPELDQKIQFVITLFCGHNSEPELTDRIVQRLNNENEELIDFRYRSGLWRGQITLTFADRSRVVPFTTFSDYQNLYFLCQRKCLYCEDHFGYYGDLSAGDIWSVDMKSESIKPTSIITRNVQAENLLRSAADSGILQSKPVSIDDIFQGQIRTARFHYQVSARSRIGRLFGEKIPDTVQAKVRLVEYLIAAIALSNYRLSRSEIGKRILFAIPRPVLRLYLYLFKALESI